MEEDNTPIPHKIPCIERVQNEDLSKVLLFKLTLCSPKIIFSAEDLKEWEKGKVYQVHY